ncbi:hypothetical protein [Mesorhizobium loti]|uniref:Uncharacterized protein n=1 Tax=Mesorhizobium loti R88b TaxID=935548 RepID=A0A6M7WVK9_RHILI|nr:hypothetical protein [Mesorhizobium loti]QKD06112.1 hypothetical protein EB235_05505 [Mesorhizobium loti R88b]
MSKRIDRSWVVFASVENDEHDRCVDIFSRPDKSFGYEEFRRDVEDGGAWTPTEYYSGARYATAELAYAAAEKSVVWLAEVLRVSPKLRRIPPSH